MVQWSGSCPAGDNLVVKFKSRRGNFVFFCTFFGSDFVFVFVFLSYFSLWLVSLYFYWSPFQHGKIVTIITYF